MKTDFYEPIDPNRNSFQIQIFAKYPEAERFQFEDDELDHIISLASMILFKKHRFELDVVFEGIEVSIESEDGYRLIFLTNLEGLMLLFLDKVFEQWNKEKLKKIQKEFNP